MPETFRLSRALAGACVCLGLNAALVATAQADVKIGFLGTLSGPGGTLGQDQYDGFMLGITKAGGKLGGQAVQVIKEDDQLKPEVGRQAVKKLIERDKVDVVTGMSFSNVLMAVVRDVVNSGTVLISSNAGPSQLAGDQCSPLYFSTSWQNDQQHEAMGKYAQDKGYRRIAIMAPNYQAGKEALIGFKRYFKGEILSETYTQVNQPDYSVEITQLQTQKPDAVFIFYPGGMGVNFVKQYQQAGMLGKTPLLSGSTVDGTTLPALKDIALGVMSAGPWSPDLPNAANKTFVADFQKAYNRIPSAYAAYGYDAALALDAALKTTGGKADGKTLSAALAKTTFPSVRGGFRFNNNHFPVSNYYAFEVVRDASGTVNLATRSTVFPDHQDPYHASCPLP
ncbi:ABC transporter substrate-binding protein [Pigmentiphaga litoralis]|uniref:Branched-chain amino acid transport system substrate-binding protein n=1 Tax=Pigmentiphaga litoralis TaxID=516702 RepID=A0A7Y9IU12_9BURK|nr:ABC transporter substrate-binding protein [Pigmentiphaga litoralis]NYE23457.1 branched-chain amino acid transport system substrate-binding protein [Pigmentiphaga litoralis]NYE82929.1 branched-chain amino acid transport system substrate-binding protein [Pigmentiphaga litoralis]